MDSFKMVSQFNKEEFIASNLIRWELKWFRNRKNIKKYFILSTALLTLGILVGTKAEPTNPFIFIGGFNLTVVIILLFLRLRSRREFSKEIHIIAEDYEAQQVTPIYEFSDDSVKYWDKQKHLDFKWEVFTSYQLFKGHLILNINDALFETFLFKNEKSEGDNYNRVLALAQSKLELKKA